VIELFRRHQESILRLAGLEALNFTPQSFSADTSGVRPVGAGVYLRLFHHQKLDAEAERVRLERDKSKIEQLMVQTEAQLKNEGFRSRAPQEVVRATEQRHAQLSEQHGKVIESLRRLATGA
jgi:valyl-tRNA synthetase